MSPKAQVRIFFFTALLAWLALPVIDFIVLSGQRDHMLFDLPYYVKSAPRLIFLLCSFFAFKALYAKPREDSFTDLLTGILNTGVITVGISFTLRQFIKILSPYEGDFFASVISGNVLYHIEVALYTIFLLNTLFIFKKKILFGRNDRLVFTWRLFEYVLLATLLLGFFRLRIYDLPFFIPLILLFGIILLLSWNFRWIAYLSLGHKWQAIAILLLTVGVVVYFDPTFVYRVKLIGSIDSGNDFFTVGCSLFVALYATFSILVIVFNLPTSAVFRQKMEEIQNFQRLTRSVAIGRNENNIYEVLLESIANIAVADAAWIARYGAEENGTFRYTMNATDTFTRAADKAGITALAELSDDVQYFRSIKKKDLWGEFLRAEGFYSLLIVPLRSENQRFGTIFLLRNVKDGFDRENVEVLKTFTGQTALSLENIRLFNETLEQEKYLEEVETARKVKKSLLPERLTFSDEIEAAVFSRSADEVGGDYYDFYDNGDGKYTLVLGDVAGNGTSAAFRAAQLKGIFQCLAPLRYSPDQFMINTNKALARCLPINSFATLLLVTIDSKNRHLEICRAGHCPPFYCKAENEREFIQIGGPGLGIIRKENYSLKFPFKQYTYKTGDVLVLYTDGITEAVNEQGEEFGYARLQNSIENIKDLSAQAICRQIEERFSDFCDTRTPVDDHTIIVLKF